MTEAVIDIVSAKKQFSEFVNASNWDVPIYELYKVFIVEKMKLDKYFSQFLEDNEKEMSESVNFDSPAWKAYRIKLKEYDEIEKLVAQSRYYVNKHV